jgi:hypothetical protein
MALFSGYVTRDVVAERLPLIFPEGAPNSGYCTRMTSEQAAKPEIDERTITQPQSPRRVDTLKESAGTLIIRESLFVTKHCAMGSFPSAPSPAERISQQRRPSLDMR